MAENKTTRNDGSVEKFLNSVANEDKRRDAWTVLELMQKITKTPPKMWGTSIVGFGSYHYKYASGREGDSPYIGFSPRAQDLTLYIMPGFDEYDALLAKLGKHKLGKSCLYIKSLDDIHLPTLKELVKQAFQHMKKTNRPSAK